ncbi:MAG: thiaminase II [Candidatus Dormibacterales bacterium]
MGFSSELRQRADAIWAAQRQHPFVRGIADGTLGVNRFQFWVRQDYLFLIEYCRLFGLAAARAPDLETLSRFADLLQATAGTEMDLHRRFAAEFGISIRELELEAMAPTTRAYTDFLVRLASTGEFCELVAALLPCMWAYSELGRALAAWPRPQDNRYQAWIEMYSSDKFAELARWCRELLDRLANDIGDRPRRRMEDAFVTSSRYELGFWQMAWTLEEWPT